ncbi:hypothetical protein D3C85_454940 [compost metagenome]
MNDKFIVDTLNTMAYFIFRQVMDYEDIGAFEELETWISKFDEAFIRPVADEVIILEAFQTSIGKELHEGSYFEEHGEEGFFLRLREFMTNAQSVALNWETSRFYNTVIAAVNEARV